MWRATDLRTGATVALKRLHPQIAADGTSRARFLREIDAARAVDHASVVRVLDSGDEPDGAWLVMDHLPGGSLSDRLLAGPLPAAAVAAIGADVARALAAVHAVGLVHRDVKPSNILFDASGAARLADFGIARAGGVTGVDDVTATGDLVGTLRFLAPEVLAGSPATPAADVWALGAVLYESMTGRPPFDASSPAALVASQHSIPARSAPRGDALSDAIEAMLAPDPAARPSASDAAATLARLAPAGDRSQDLTVVTPAPALVGSPVRLATPPPAPAPDARPAPVRRLARAGVLAAVLLLAGFLVLVNGPLGATSEGVVATPTGTPPASPGATPGASEGNGVTGASPANRGNGKGPDKPKPDKPGKGNGH